MFSVNWMKITVHLSFPGVQNAIANASTLAEVERLKGLLQSGQTPGRERRAGPTDDGEEEMEEDTVANGS